MTYNDPNEQARLDAIINNPSYEKAYRDLEFIGRRELRPLRLELELLKPQIILEEEGIHETIVVFGGTQIIESNQAADELAIAAEALQANPGDKKLQRAVHVAEKRVAKSKYYDEGREFGGLVSEKANAEEGVNRKKRRLCARRVRQTWAPLVSQPLVLQPLLSQGGRAR